MAVIKSNSDDRNYWRVYSEQKLKAKEKWACCWSAMLGSIEFASWYNQKVTGRYKKHCFFAPTVKDCPSAFGTFG